MCPLCRAASRADGIIMVYDVTSAESFDHVEEWLSEVDRYANENTSKLLLGNKADLSDLKQVQEETAQVRRGATRTGQTWARARAGSHAGSHAHQARRGGIGSGSGAWPGSHPPAL